MGRVIKFMVGVGGCGEFEIPSDSFSLCLHDTGHKLQMWSSDGLVDEMDVEYIRQFTGLTDKNGKEIYEGDIVRDNFAFIDVLLEIKFCRDGHTKTIGFHAYKSNGDLDDFYGGMPGGDSLEVIGNIYESPELLEGSV